VDRVNTCANPAAFGGTFPCRCMIPTFIFSCRCGSSSWIVGIPVLNPRLAHISWCSADPSGFKFGSLRSPRIYLRRDNRWRKAKSPQPFPYREKRAVGNRDRDFSNRRIVTTVDMMWQAGHPASEIRPYSRSPGAVNSPPPVAAPFETGSPLHHAPPTRILRA